MIRGKAGQDRQLEHDPWPSRRLVSAWFACFAVYAGLLGLLAGGEDGIWGAWGFGAYALAALVFRFAGDRMGDRWWPGLAVVVGGGLIGPFLYLAATQPDPAEVTVMARGAVHLLRHGTPYLPVSQLTAWTSYNPYLPLMDLFGLPRAGLGTATGLARVIGDPRIYTSLFTGALLAVSFALMARHDVRTCRQCRARGARITIIAVTSPIIGFPLVLGITDPPVIAVTILALAFLSRGWLARTALAVAVACALKYTAWPLVPVFAVMAWARYSARDAARFTVTTLAAACALALAAAPNALSNPGSILQNTIDYPLGLTKIKTVAASPLPGHLLASTGQAGHTAAVAILGVAGLAFAVWLLVRPPRTDRDVAVRLAIAYILLFTLAPATRYGYYIYPLALLFWLPLSRSHEPRRQEAR
ncbi:MAG TPA: glycosyltransferase 87 family protein [Trebonia sp.]|nr:glycosyltransferase 87 family protein [Trebonia sp.]